MKSEPGAVSHKHLDYYLDEFSAPSSVAVDPTMICIQVVMLMVRSEWRSSSIRACGRELK
jgi:hypothetical protein